MHGTGYSVDMVQDYNLYNHLMNNFTDVLCRQFTNAYAAIVDTLVV